MILPCKQNMRKCQRKVEMSGVYLAARGRARRLKPVESGTEKVGDMVGGGNGVSH